eukprot:364392-Chlamydomonas_euryale.AAC.2
MQLGGAGVGWGGTSGGCASPRREAARGQAARSVDAQHRKGRQCRGGKGLQCGCAVWMGSAERSHAAAGAPPPPRCGLGCMAAETARPSRRSRQTCRRVDAWERGALFRLTQHTAGSTHDGPGLKQCTRSHTANCTLLQWC